MTMFTTWMIPGVSKFLASGKDNQPIYIRINMYVYMYMYVYIHVCVCSGSRNSPISFHNILHTYVYYIIAYILSYFHTAR